MTQSYEIEQAIIDDIKFGALAVMNKALKEPLATGADFEKWPAEDKAKYFLILDVEEEVMRRVNQTFGRRHKKK